MAHQINGGWHLPRGNSWTSLFLEYSLLCIHPTCSFWNSYICSKKYDSFSLTVIKIWLEAYSFVRTVSSLELPYFFALKPVTVMKLGEQTLNCFWWKFTIFCFLYFLLKYKRRRRWNNRNTLWWSFLFNFSRRSYAGVASQVLLKRRKTCKDIMTLIPLPILKKKTR